MAVTRRGAVQHRADGVNRLSIAADDSADVTLAKLDLENGHFPRDFSEHHVVGKLDQLANDELEKLLHGRQATNHEGHE